VVDCKVRPKYIYGKRSLPYIYFGKWLRGLRPVTQMMFHFRPVQACFQLTINNLTTYSLALQTSIFANNVITDMKAPDETDYVQCFLCHICKDYESFRVVFIVYNIIIINQNSLLSSHVFHLFNFIFVLWLLKM
jgi:hypothetical protein